MSQSENTLQVAVYLNVQNIVAAYGKPTADSIIDLVNAEGEKKQFYKFPSANDKGTIMVPIKSKKISFTLGDSNGRSDGRFWLTRFINKDKGIIAPSSPNKGGDLVPANILTVDVNPKVKKGETEGFKLHCYFIYFNESTGENWVYHCKTDPRLQTEQGGG